MTRAEEIKKQAEKKAHEPSRLMHPYAKQYKVMSAYEIGFIEGAVWADEHPHWISVEDELPPLGCSMIVLISYGADVQLGEWDNGLFHEIELGVIIHPTHWMPMPSVEHLRESTKMIEKGGEE